MNTRAFELGMRDTVYVNCTGYDDERQYSTAYDTALLAREMIKHDILIQYMTVWHDYVRGEQTELVNENTLTRTYEGMLGVKAGHSDMSGNCVAFAVSKNNLAYISVVLGCADKDERFSEAKNLVQTGFSGYQTAVPNLRSEYILPVKVKGGTESAVNLKAGKIPVLSVPKGRDDDIECIIIIPKYINAPVHKNQKIGSASFYLDDTLLCSTDIMAETDVSSVTIGNAFKQIYIKLLK
jgi:D-alanyl-D-alanine carboxypeptidase (penicillin-binding protein 5/6)